MSHFFNPIVDIQFGEPNVFLVVMSHFFNPIVDIQFGEPNVFLELHSLCTSKSKDWKAKIDNVTIRLYVYPNANVVRT